MTLVHRFIGEYDYDKTLSHQWYARRIACAMFGVPVSSAGWTPWFDPYHMSETKANHDYGETPTIVGKWHLDSNNDWWLDFDEGKMNIRSRYAVSKEKFEALDLFIKAFIAGV